MTRTILFAAGWALCLAGGAAQADPRTLFTTEGACFAMTQDAADGPIHEMTVELRARPASEDGAGGLSITLSFVDRDLPEVVFSTGTGCYGDDGRPLECQIDCDGGRAVLLAAPNGDLLLEALSIVYSGEGAQNPYLVTMEPDAAQLSGLFRLAPSPRQGLCRPAQAPVIAPLAAGDISPRVATAERLLAALGLHPEQPDLVFDARTRASVVAFQTDFGLPASGRLDSDTMLSLARAVQLGGPC